MYTVTDLAPNTIGEARALALNATGVAVGEANFSVTPLPGGAIVRGTGFVWTPIQPHDTVGTLQDVGTLMPSAGAAVSACRAQAVSDAGDVVGTSDALDSLGSKVSRAFLFRAGMLSDLGTLNRDPNNQVLFTGNSRGFGVNDNGQIVGGADDARGVEHAFLLDLSGGGGMQALGSLLTPSAGTDTSVAHAITSFGTIVGESSADDASGTAVQRGFIRSPAATTLTDLGTLIPDSVNPGTFLGNSSALAVNEHGQAVGVSDIPAPAGNPVVQLGVIFGAPSIPFGPNPSAATASAVGVQPIGTQTAGWLDRGSPASGSDFAAFMFTSSTGVIDLNTQLATPDWKIDKAFGVNSVGQICGEATHSTLGGPRAVLLTPLPP